MPEALERFKAFSLAFSASLLSCACAAALSMAAAGVAAALARSSESAKGAFGWAFWALFALLAALAARPSPPAPAGGEEAGRRELELAFLRRTGALAGLALACWLLLSWGYPAALRLAAAAGLFS